MAEEKKELQEKELPSTEQKEKKVRKRTPKIKDLPPVGKPENTVLIGEKLVEIKPTKLKYHRSNVAYFYKIVETIPLPDLLALPAGAFGDDRDGDKALMDWLIAVTDDPELIYRYYNELDTETIETILLIFKRVNKIDEKEAAQKNAVSQAQKG